MVNWEIVCECKSTNLSAHGSAIQIAICHCADCRKANQEQTQTQTLALLRRDQIETRLDELDVIPGEQYNDGVPRYFCKQCKRCLFGDCTPIGFDMVIVPVEVMTNHQWRPIAQYHMHVEEKVVDIADDGLPQFMGNPEGVQMQQLIDACS